MLTLRLRLTRPLVLGLFLSVNLLSSACTNTPSASPNDAGQQASAPASRYENQLIRRSGNTAEDSKVYIVRGGKKHWVVDASWFGVHGRKFPDEVQVISREELASIPTGDPITTAAPAIRYENRLIRRNGKTAEDGKVYIVQGGKKRWVVNASWYAAHGYKFPDEVQVVSPEDLALIPTGDPIQ